MAFDPATAKPVNSPTSSVGKQTAFDPSTAGAASFSTSSPAQQFVAEHDKRLDSGVMALEQGNLYGGADEIFAGVTALDAGLANLFKKVTGKKTDYTMGEVYNEALKRNRAAPERFKQEYPGGNYLGGEVLGSILGGGPAIGGKWIADAPSLLSKIARGAAVGAPVGAAAGFASGKGGAGERAIGAAEGATVGAGLGVIPPSLGGAVRVGSKVLGRAAQAIRSALQDTHGMTPEEAADKLSPKELEKLKDQAIQIVHDTLTSAGHDTKALTDDVAHQLGKPITAAETSSPLTKMLMSVGRRVGETGDAAESFFRQRNLERGDRIMGNLSQASGLKPEHVQGNMEELAENLREQNPVLYAKAESHPPVDIAENKDLLHLFSQPNMQKALAYARQISENRGLPWTYGGADRKLTWKQLDLVKRGLQTAIKRETPKNALGQLQHDDLSRADVDTDQRFRDVLFKLNPDYQKAVQHAGEPLTLERAYNEAPKYMGLSATARQFDKKINDMGPAEFAAFKAGWVNDVYTKLRRDKLQPKDLNTPEFMEKAQRLLGADKAKTFVSEIQQELRMREGERKIPPSAGSQTAPLLHAGEELDQKSLDMAEDFFHSMNRRGVSFAVKRAALNALFSVFQAVKTPEREALRNEIGKLLLKRPDELRAIVEQHKKVQGGTKLKAAEIASMMSHLMNSGTVPIASTSAQEVNQ